MYALFSIIFGSKFKGYTECFTYVDVADVQEMFYTLSQCKREIEELS